MPNMSYVRFQNTLGDLRDCYDAIDEVDDLGEEEAEARRSLLVLCAKIATEYESEIDEIKTERDKQFHAYVESRRQEMVAKVNKRKAKGVR